MTKRSILCQLLIIALCAPSLSLAQQKPAAKKPTTTKKAPSKKAPAKKKVSKHVHNPEALYLPNDTFELGDTIPELPDTTREALITTGDNLIGKGGAAFKVGEDSFTWDCIGFVETVYHKEGIPFRDVLVLSDDDKGSAVRAAYRTVKRYGILFKDEVTPQPGDLIFWDNTFDHDKDGRYDDPLTHVGMVAEVLPDGTVKYIHRGGKGVSYGYMNLTTPELSKNEAGESINSQLRYKNKKDPSHAKYRSGELFVAFGRFDPDKLAEAFKKKSDVDFEALGNGAW
jgi:cell wall-associated NlpC family hydrolase